MTTTATNDQHTTPPPERAGMRAASVRTHNLAEVAAAIHVAGPLTRSDICDLTGLTRSTVAALVGELEAGGLARERAAVSDGTPGRPSPVVSFVDHRAVLAFEVVVDSIAVAAVALDGTVLSQWRQDRSRSPLTPEQTLRDFVRLTGSCRREAGNPEILAIGVAVAGLIRHSDSMVAHAPNLGWESVPFGSQLLDALDLDVPILVRNEGELGMLAEARRGAGRGIDDLVFIQAEVGIGGGILSGGTVVSGHEGYGGEIGHIPINPAGAACRCGASGCWEVEVGEATLLRRAGLDPTGGGVEVEQLLTNARAGDRQALAALSESGRWLGLGIAALVNIFNPSIVVLGGMYGPAFDHVIEPIRDELRSRSFPTFRSVDVVRPSFTEGAPMIGASELAAQQVVAEPGRFFAT